MEVIVVKPQIDRCARTVARLWRPVPIAIAKQDIEKCGHVIIVPECGIVFGPPHRKTTDLVYLCGKKTILKNKCCFKSVITYLTVSVLFYVRKL